MFQVGFVTQTIAEVTLGATCLPACTSVDRSSKALFKKN